MHYVYLKNLNSLEKNPYLRLPSCVYLQSYKQCYVFHCILFSNETEEIRSSLLSTGMQYAGLGFKVRKFIHF